MSLMQAQRQGDPEYPKSTLLKSSHDLGWSALIADLCSQAATKGPGLPRRRMRTLGLSFVAPTKGT
jgi:hypothetical protein